MGQVFGEKCCRCLQQTDIACEGKCLCTLVWIFIIYIHKYVNRRIYICIYIYIFYKMIMGFGGSGAVLDVIGCVMWFHSRCFL